MLNALDVLSTRAVLAAGGVEANPLLSSNLWATAGIKVAVLVVVGAGVWLVGRRPWVLRMLLGVGWIYVGVVVWNLTAQ